MERTWKSKAAGVLCIIVGVIVVVISGMAGGLLVGPAMTSKEPILAIFLVLVGAPSIMFGVLAIIGGICALRRRIWALSLVGSISALILGIVTSCIGLGIFGALFSLEPPWSLLAVLAFVVFALLGLLALVFVIRGRREFR